MPNLLKNLKINTIGSVDMPANPNAVVTIIKRNDTNAPNGTLVEGVIKSPRIMGTVNINKFGEECVMMPLDQAVVDALPEEVKVYIKQLENKVAELQQQIDSQPSGGVQKGVDAGDDIFKSLPEPVKKYIQDIEKRAKEAEELAKREREERITKEFIAKAAEFQALPIKAEEFGPVLKSMSEANAEAYGKLVEVLKAANELVAKSKLFDEIGKRNADGGGDAWSIINAKADSIVQKNAGVTREQAIAQVLRENPDLYEAYQKELVDNQ